MAPPLHSVREPAHKVHVQHCCAQPDSHVNMLGQGARDMRNWASLLWWILALGVGLVWLGGWHRNRRLERWGAQVALSTVQFRALDQIWRARDQGPYRSIPSPACRTVIGCT